VNKYGKKNILKGFIECSSEQIALDLEQGIIKCFKRMGVKLTNMTDGGEGMSGHRHTEETKRIIGEAARKAMTGYVPSAEARANMSKAAKGRKHTEATKAKLKQLSSDYWKNKENTNV
jgi:glycerate kinase